MIVTRSWLSEFIDLSDVSNSTLYKTFNAIGLEVDSIEQIKIAPKVVVGEILSCEKHPDADKLNVCQIETGDGVKQIVCGAANVVDAKFVAVATIGAVLPGDFKIKPAKLRGVESAGMVCSSGELGLPEMGKGIMILDESIGTLEVGREVGSYEKVADTIITLELTANRGDCLSIYGVARDLSAALNIEMKPFEYKQTEKMKLGIAREADLQVKGTINADLCYKLASLHSLSETLLLQLRLGMVGVQAEGKLASILAYATHTTGVILRAYKSEVFTKGKKCLVEAVQNTIALTDICAGSQVVSTVGVNQSTESIATDTTTKLFLEASYVNPDQLTEAVVEAGLSSDELYYKTSRGSNPDLNFGLSYLAMLMAGYTDINCYEGMMDYRVQREKQKIIVDAKEVSSIIGMTIESGRVVTILQKLGFAISSMGDNIVAVTVPLFRHDIRNIQDITEEIVRIVGINNIEAKPLVFAEEARLNSTTQRYHLKKQLRNRAVGAGFYENVSYIFAQREVLEKYDFATVVSELDLTNPIAEELNTLRSTTLTNLLNAAKRNVSYTKKSIPLFEIGAVFDANRQQREVLSFLFSGELTQESVTNAGKPKMVDFATFTEKMGAVIGAFELVACSHKNGLLHPYQSADILIDGKVCGFVSKLHPTVEDAFDLPVTFIAELDFDAVMPRHINATPISKFQGVYKDLSVVIDKSVSYSHVAKVLAGIDAPMLKSYYPVDIYEDEKLGDQKSLTIRFVIQSMEKTLKDSDTEAVLQRIMQALQEECGATLR